MPCPTVLQHAAVVLAVGESPEYNAVFAEPVVQQFRRRFRQIAYGQYITGHQLARRCRSDVQKLRYGQRPYAPLPVVPGQRRYRVRLFHVAAQLGKDLIETDAYGDREPQLIPDRFSDLLCLLPDTSSQHSSIPYGSILSV